MAYCRLGEIYGILGEGTKASEYLTKAYPLRDRVTELEKYNISSQYYFGVTGEMEKAKQLCELWAQSYPRETEAHLNLGFIYAVFGNYEKANEETLEAIKLDPDSSIGYSNLIQGYACVNQLDKAKAMYQEAVRRKVDNGGPHAYMYGVAFLERDREEMERQAKWAADKPGVADWLLSYQSDTEAFFGRLAKARELTQRAVQSARQNDQKEGAAGWQMNGALREAEFGNTARAHEQTMAVLASVPDAGAPAALALARSRRFSPRTENGRRGAKESPARHPLRQLLVADHSCGHRNRSQQSRQGYRVS